MSITAETIATGALSTDNYAEDGNGNPIAGAHLDHKGTALKLAAGNFQIGAFNMAEMQRRYQTSTSGTAASFTVSGLSEPDTDYLVHAVPYSITGSFNSYASLIVRQVTKGTSSFTVYLADVAGTGCTIYWDVTFLRVP